MIGKYKCEHCGSITNIKDWRVESNNAYNFKYYHCPVCDKVNYYPRRILEQNNEEWFINLPTKEKAKVLDSLMVGMSNLRFEIEEILNNGDLDMTHEEAVEIWLKAVHK